MMLMVVLLNILRFRLRLIPRPTWGAVCCFPVTIANIHMLADRMMTIAGDYRMKTVFAVPEKIGHDDAAHDH